MCERTCPGCGSTDHYEGYGITGTSITCNDCGLLLAHRHDSENVPLTTLDHEIDDYVYARSGVRPGAEAKDPKDDEIYQGTAFSQVNP